jgi:hypothetical protein
MARRISDYKFVVDRTKWPEETLATLRIVIIVMVFVNFHPSFGWIVILKMVENNRQL